MNIINTYSSSLSLQNDGGEEAPRTIYLNTNVVFKGIFKSKGK
jgi:hypothetical protein